MYPAARLSTCSLQRASSTLGPNIGRVISYDDVRKWINNTLFMDRMSGGWIGSRSPSTIWLSEPLEADPAARRSVVIAVETARSAHRYRCRNRIEIA